MLICGGTIFVSIGAEFTILLCIDIQVWNYLDLFDGVRWRSMSYLDRFDGVRWRSMFALTGRFGTIKSLVSCDFLL
jgi:hypothetical protein